MAGHWRRILVAVDASWSPVARRSPRRMRTSCVTSMTGPGSPSWIIRVNIMSLAFDVFNAPFTFFYMFSSFIVSSLKYRIYFHNLGINYWLKSELLATTEVGEYGQFWLGAFTEVRSFTNCCDVMTTNWPGETQRGIPWRLVVESQEWVSLLVWLGWWTGENEIIKMYFYQYLLLNSPTTWVARTALLWGSIITSCSLLPGI